MGDVVMVDPQGLELLPVRLNEELNDTLNMEVESLKENPVPIMSMDDGLRLIDEWIAEREVHAFNDALGIGSSTTSSWPEPNNQDLGSENE